MDGTLIRPVRIVHASPGRIRVRIQPEDIGSPALDKAERALARVPGVRAVQTNPLARSLAVTYDHRVLGTEDLLAGAARAGFSFVAEPEDTVGTAKLRPIDETITTFFRDADEQVRGNLGGAVDLRTLVPAGLALLALREILAGRLVGMPWYVLIWYSFDSFLKLRRSEPASKPTPE
jgi:hypothetical protein